MKEFLKNCGIFLLIMATVIFVVPLATSFWVQQKDFNNGNTESNLLVLNETKAYDYLFLGNSHARNFSRYNQHGNFEKILDGKILNMGQGRGICGPNDQAFYLQYLLDQGFTFKHIVHAVSPPYVYGNHLNKVTTTFFEEPFSLSVFYEYSKYPTPNKTHKLLHYLKTKFKPSWIRYRPDTETGKKESLSTVDSLKIKDGIKLAYPFGLKEADFAQNAKHIEATVKMAKSFGIQFSILQTPLLFDSWPGQERFNQYCDSLSKAEQINFIDLSQIEKTPKYYYDHHHLNTDGLQRILPQLKKELSKK